MAIFHGASRRFSHEYGTILAILVSITSIFLDSSRLSAHAVRTTPLIFIPKERGVRERFGSKNCPLKILNGVWLNVERTSDIFCFSKSGSPLISSYHHNLSSASIFHHLLRSISCTQRSIVSYFERVTALPVSIV